MHTIDTHSHFNLRQFDTDRNEAIARMKEAGVGTICIGIDEESSELATTLAADEFIWACVGQHPTEWDKEYRVDAMRALAQKARVVGIGECGLDYFREGEREHKDEQKKLFRAQIELAQELGLPLMLHIRPQQGTMDAYEDALAILKEYEGLRGTAHFFIGTEAIAQQFLDLGFYISFSGVITIFPEYEPLVAFVPMDRILSETDAPFAAPVPYRGKRCEPQYVLEVIRKVAEIKGIALEEAQKQLLGNAKALFGI
jgi:TatD DNase family protein